LLASGLSVSLIPGNVTLALAAPPAHIPPRRPPHAPNAMGNFCFDVTLSYRRLERPRRAPAGE